MRDLECEIWLTLRRGVLGIQPFVKAYLSKSSGRDEAPQTPVQVNTLCWPRVTFPTLAAGFLFASFYGNCGTKFPEVDRERQRRPLASSNSSSCLIQSLSYSGDLLETRKWSQST